MKYVAFLRGINVGGNSIVKMADLKTAFENCEFANVSTYINSGNIIFESSEASDDKLEEKIESLLKKNFFPIKTVVISKVELEDILNKVPNSWKSADLRKYIAFVKKPAKPEDVLKEAQPKEGVDFIDKGPQVVYMSTKMAGLTQSSFPKLITKKIYKEMTIRNYNTAGKLLSLMENKSLVGNKKTKNYF